MRRTNQSNFSKDKKKLCDSQIEWNLNESGSKMLGIANRFGIILFCFMFVRNKHIALCYRKINAEHEEYVRCYSQTKTKKSYSKMIRLLFIF